MELITKENYKDHYRLKKNTSYPQKKGIMPFYNKFISALFIFLDNQ